MEDGLYEHRTSDMQQEYNIKHGEKLYIEFSFRRFLQIICNEHESISIL
jgi:hypothetical protein